MTTLLDKCVCFLKKDINISSVVRLLEYSLLISADELTTECLSYIGNNAWKIVKANGLDGVSEEALKQVVAQDDMRIFEVDLFRTCVRWARGRIAASKTEGLSQEEPNLRIALGNVFQQIRFPAMSIEEFSSEVVTLDLLTTEEVYEIYKYYSSRVKPKCRFPTKQRWPMASLLKLNQNYIEIPMTKGAKCKVEINANASVKLEAVYFVGDNIHLQSTLTISDLMGRAAGGEVRWCQTGQNTLISGAHDHIKNGNRTYSVHKLDLRKIENAIIVPGDTLSWTHTLDRAKTAADKQEEAKVPPKGQALLVMAAAAAAALQMKVLCGTGDGIAQTCNGVTFSIPQNDTPLYAFEFTLLSD